MDLFLLKTSYIASGCGLKGPIGIIWVRSIGFIYLQCYCQWQSANKRLCQAQKCQWWGAPALRGWPGIGLCSEVCLDRAPGLVRIIFLFILLQMVETNSRTRVWEIVNKKKLLNLKAFGLLSFIFVNIKDPVILGQSIERRNKIAFYFPCFLMRH